MSFTSASTAPSKRGVETRWRTKDLTTRPRPGCSRTQILRAAPTFPTSIPGQGLGRIRVTTRWSSTAPRSRSKSASTSLRSRRGNFLPGRARSHRQALRNMAGTDVCPAVRRLGAGALFPIVVAVIGDLYSPLERGRFQGLFGGVFALSFIVGPFIGGWITDHISWHWVFYVNVPFGVASLVVLATVLPSAGRRQASIRDLDYLGIVLFTAGVVPFMLGLTNKGNVNSSGQLANWTDPDVGGLIVVGLVILVVFLFVEARTKEPIIPLDLFRERDYAVSMAAVFAFGIAMFAAVLFLPRFCQTVRGVSPTASGYHISPLLVGLMGGSIGT